MLYKARPRLLRAAVAGTAAAVATAGSAAALSRRCLRAVRSMMIRLRESIRT